MGIGVVAKNHLQPPSTKLLRQITFQMLYTVSYFLCHSHVISMRLHFTYIYGYATRMSVVCTCMSSECHSYVLVRHPYVTRMYSYVIRMSTVCTHNIIRMSLVFTRTSSVCHLCVLLCHTYVNSMYSYIIMNLLLWQQCKYQCDIN